MRNQDLVGRLGGEEFVIVLPETGADAAMVACDRLRQAIADATLVPATGEAISITVSAGVAQMVRGDDRTRLIARADVALYDAKTSAGIGCCSQPQNSVLRQVGQIFHAFQMHAFPDRPELTLTKLLTRPRGTSARPVSLAGKRGGSRRPSWTSAPRRWRCAWRPSAAGRTKDCVRSAAWPPESRRPC